MMYIFSIMNVILFIFVICLWFLFDFVVVEYKFLVNCVEVSIDLMEKEFCVKFKFYVMMRDEEDLDFFFILYIGVGKDCCYMLCSYYNFCVNNFVI